MLRPPRRGSLADNAAKTITEVRLIGKSAFQCDFPKRSVGYAHQFLRTCDPHSPDILIGATTEARFEAAIEFAAVELRDPGQIARSDLRVKMNCYIALDAARLPDLHACEQCADPAPAACASLMGIVRSCEWRPLG